MPEMRQSANPRRGVDGRVWRRPAFCLRPRSRAGRRAGIERQSWNGVAPYGRGIVKKIVIVNDEVLGRQRPYGATKNDRREVGGHELVGMGVVDVNRNALGGGVLFVEMPGEGKP